MTIAVERLVNLTLTLAEARGSISGEEIRRTVTGYPADSDEAAFKRMLERDKDTLRAAGLVIEADELGNYRLDQAATYVSPITLAPAKAAVVRTVALAMLDDPSFPFVDDLRLTLLKLSAEVDTAGPSAAPPKPSAISTLADEDPERQGALAAQLASAVSARKRASFAYTNSLGFSAPHTIEPYGLFVHGGRWYLVGRDADKDDVRTYAVARIAELKVNPAAPKTQDFERPADFDLASFIRLPFQYGPESAAFGAVLEFDAANAWDAERISAGHGRLSPTPGGAVRWEIDARSEAGLLRFIIENGPGLRVVAPAGLADRLKAGLSEVEALHG